VHDSWIEKRWLAAKVPLYQPLIRWKADLAQTRYGGAVDVKRAADLYAQGWTLRQIANYLGLTETTVSDQLRRAGVTMRRSGPPAYSASTD
jgi:Homeodomain-like domain